MVYFVVSPVVVAPAALGGYAADEINTWVVQPGIMIVDSILDAFADDDVPLFPSPSSEPGSAPDGIREVGNTSGVHLPGDDGDVNASNGGVCLPGDDDDNAPSFTPMPDDSPLSDDSPLPDDIPHPHDSEFGDGGTP